MDRIFFISDTHFQHKAILHLGGGRPFDTVDEMDEAMISNWNDRVEPGDRVYHLGDFSFAKPDRTLEILKQLNGQIFLIEGNHDTKRMKPEVKKKFIWVKTRFNLKIADEDAINGRQMIVLDHFPMEIWDKRHYGAWHLHGHCHHNLKSDRKQPCRIDVGVDGWNFAPVSYQEIKSTIQARQKDGWDLDFKDHHSDKRQR